MWKTADPDAFAQEQGSWVFNKTNILIVQTVKALSYRARFVLNASRNACAVSQWIYAVRIRQFLHMYQIIAYQQPLYSIYHKQSETIIPYHIY